MATNKYISPHVVNGLWNEQLNMLHVQIATLTFSGGFREYSEVGMMG